MVIAILHAATASVAETTTAGIAALASRCNSATEIAAIVEITGATVTAVTADASVLDTFL